MDFTMMKVFGTGQVTIPKDWRNKFGTDVFAATLEENHIVLVPISKPKTKAKWVNIFNAAKDNKGKGIPLDEFIKMME
jgi:bifunctional DNA-binding transcriptional regulator/antitoxin component of YhaV-PrlF toxin-antitoxin module